MTTSRIILALDELDLCRCIELAGAVGKLVHAIKIHSLFDQEGPEVVRQLRMAGARRIWVDAKLHDIPNTVKLRAKAIAKSGADILTVHASGGVEMMRAAKESADGAEVYAVTVLTSLSPEIAKIIYGTSAEDAVLMLANLAKEAGVDGVVCSPREVEVLAKSPELQGLKFITPGVRSLGKKTDDQRRVDTPERAIASGSTHLVVGRQITQAANPVEALRQIEEEIASATG